MDRSLMGSDGCCNSRACTQWIIAAGYNPEDVFPDEVCRRCGGEGPYYLYHEAQKYGWGGGADVLERLKVLRETRGNEVERLFQYVVRRLISKINFKGMVDQFANQIGDLKKADEACRALITLAASGLEMYDRDEDSKAYYDGVTAGRAPMELDVFRGFRKLISEEMDVWFRARGLLLIGESVETVEAILKEEIGDDDDK